MYNPPPVMNSQTKILRFEAIPVIDLMGGQVVRARHGERHNYRPIDSSLCGTSDPLAVARALSGLYPFETLYIADLDAIQKRGDHLETVAKLRTALPGANIWIDAGISSLEESVRWLELGLDCVVGSESQHDIDIARRLIESIGRERTVLSLDFVGGHFKGPGALLQNADLWPERVIAMTLGRVGSYQGPDFDLLQSLQLRAGDRRIYAAGGVRDADDLGKLKSHGFAGALLASALHDGKIAPEELFTR